MAIWDVTKPSNPAPQGAPSSPPFGGPTHAYTGEPAAVEPQAWDQDFNPDPPSNGPENVSTYDNPVQLDPQSTLSVGETTAKASQRDTQLNWGTRMPPLKPVEFDEVSNGQLKELDTDPITMERGSNQFLRGNMDSATFRFAPDGNQMGEGQRVRTESPPYDGPDHINPAGSPQTSLEE